MTRVAIGSDHAGYHAVDAFLDAEFEGGRHQRRIDEITDLEKQEES